MEILTSSKGTKFYVSVYTKLDIPVIVLSTENNGIPCGVILPLDGHGDWIYIDGTIAPKNFVGLPQLLENADIDKYMDSIGESVEFRKNIQFIAWEAHRIMGEIHHNERYGERQKNFCNDCC